MPYYSYLLIIVEKNFVFNTYHNIFHLCINTPDMLPYTSKVCQKHRKNTGAVSSLFTSDDTQVASSNSRLSTQHRNCANIRPLGARLVSHSPLLASEGELMLYISCRFEMCATLYRLMIECFVYTNI